MKIKPRTVKSEMIREALYAKLIDEYEAFAIEKGLDKTRMSTELVGFVEMSTRVEFEEGEQSIVPALPTDDVKALMDKFWDYLDNDAMWIESILTKIFQKDKPLVDEAIASEKPESKN